MDRRHLCHIARSDRRESALGLQLGSDRLQRSCQLVMLIMKGCHRSNDHRCSCSTWLISGCGSQFSPTGAFMAFAAKKEMLDGRNLAIILGTDVHYLLQRTCLNKIHGVKIDEEYCLLSRDQSVYFLSQCKRITSPFYRTRRKGQRFREKDVEHATAFYP